MPIPARDGASGRKRARRRPAYQGSTLLESRGTLGGDSFAGDADHGIWVTVPREVRPAMVRAMEVMDTLVADFRGGALTASSDPARIAECHATLAAVQELRNAAEDAFEADPAFSDARVSRGRVRPEASQQQEQKRVVSAVFDRIHELAYGRLLACQSVALAAGAKKELEDFVRATETSLEAASGPDAPGDEDARERAALPVFVRSGRLSDLQSGESGEASRFTELLLYVQFSLRTRDLRRHHERVYARVHNSAGLPTAAWRDCGEISKFIHGVCRKDTNPRMWAIVAQPSDPVAAAVRYFTTADDPEFPELQRDKSVFSFDNGVYLAATNEFLPYADPAAGFDAFHPLYRGDTVPGKHFDIDFPADHHAATAADMAAWRDIPTPAVEGMFAYQDLPQGAIDMMYVTVGRMLHDVARHDNYEYVGMIVGAAGTGKSTFCMHLTKLWEADDVGVLSNNCERQFALYPFMGKFLFVAPEVKHDFKLDQAEWQGITTGDPMSCAVKYKAARAIRWTTPGFFAGNQIPDWTDHGGSVLRRLIIWRFDKRVGTENGDLPRLLEAEIPVFILKCAVAYLHTLASKGSAAMWNWVDPYFWEQRRRLTAQLNPLESFINDKIVKDPDGMVPFDEFKRSLRDFCRESGFETYKMAGDSFTTIFADHGFQKAVRRYRGQAAQVRLVDCVIGCRMRTEADNAAMAERAPDDGMGDNEPEALDDFDES
eukprot:jgi/Tetstr1/454043/TSEL_040962.t1